MADTYACGITVERPTGDLYEILGVAPDATYDEIKAARSNEPEKRYAWKALSDPKYRKLYDNHRNTDILYRAGFFDDGIEDLCVHELPTFEPSFICTPTLKVQKNIARTSNKKLAVLITTGGMAPIHNGHIAMMESARDQVEAMGFTVVGGYFAPGHDSYVGQKYGGTAAIPAAHRCAMVELATQDSDWLDCDPWAARYVPAEINFTSVVSRLSTYLFYLSFDLEIFYVYGSDNEGFGLALPNNSVMVERTNISSKAAREGDTSHLHPKVAEYLAGWDKPLTDGLPYLIRNEEDQAIGLFSNKIPADELTKRRVQFQSTIRLGLAQLFKNHGEPRKVHLLNVKEQEIEAKKVIGNRKTLSLDPFFKADALLDMTRYFEISSSQIKPLYRSHRLGCDYLKHQANAIPDGQYVLVEDDSVTGETIETALALLPQGVEVTDMVMLSDFGDYSGTEYFDIVDLRDFIVGSQFGGLSVQINMLTSGGPLLARVPYAAPYVNLRSRAKVPAEAELEFSLLIWQANVRFFKDSEVMINDCDVGFINLAMMLGYSYEFKVEQFCQERVNELMSVI